MLTFEGAEVLLGVARKAGAEEVRARFELLAAELERKIQQAPTPEQRRNHQRQLNDLVHARDTLLRR
jgi:hypothetical protein